MKQESKDIRSSFQEGGAEAVHERLGAAEAYTPASSEETAPPPSAGDSDPVTPIGEEAGNAGPPSPEKLLTLLQAREFDVRDVVQKPNPIYSIGERIICTPGNLSNIQGLAKSGKSAVVESMLAAVIHEDGREADTLGFAATNPSGHAVIHLDTEQSRYDHDRLIRKALARAGREEPPSWLHSIWTTDLDHDSRHLGLKHLMNKLSNDHGGIFAVIIDGVADFLPSVNDEEAARQLVADLHRLAIEYDCAIITVLHENPGSSSGKTRGHLGSELERKAETNLQLAKGRDEVTTIWSDRARHCSFPKSDGVCFEWNLERGMHTTRGNAAQLKAEKKRMEMRGEAEAAFGNEETHGYSELRERVMKVADVTEKTAEKHIKDFRAHGIINRENDQYRLKY